ncbi:MAG: 2Fe-2S iron-sulfur cluster-binding protein, partial [Oscillospiraceae bacterium]|nr:2Fe-2S iron-sulfur cluster-binding protein [Oscillospiraceae bacterium]
MGSMVKVSINGTDLEVSDDLTILEAARLANASIPTLCHLDLHDLKAVNQTASCRVCLVEVERSKSLVASCSTKVTQGMVIRTHTPQAVMARRTNVEILLSNHPFECLTCE